jgi:hypothetical protein
MDLRAELIQEIERFIVGRGISESTFGRLAVNDGKFVKRLRARQNVTLDRIDRAREYIRASGSCPTLGKGARDKSPAEVA